MLGLALVVAVVSALFSSPAPARAAAPSAEIETVVGGPGEGPATQLSHPAEELAVHGGRLYSAGPQADGYIRSVDLAGGQSSVFAGDVTWAGRSIYDGEGQTGKRCNGGLPARSVSAAGGSVEDLAFDPAGNLYSAGLCGVTRVDRSGNVTVVAGGNGNIDTPESKAENVPAINAKLWGPRAYAADGAGNVYYAETNGGDHCRVRRIDRAGMVNTVVGGDTCGFSGDGRGFPGDGLPTKARLRTIDDLVLDAAGNLYISDSGNHRIRKVVPGADGVVNGGDDETITTLAGNGDKDELFGCIAGDYRGDGGPAASAGLACPEGIALDREQKNLFIADRGNGRVRKVTLGTACSDVAPNCLVKVENPISTVAFNGKPGRVGQGDGGPATAAPAAAAPVEVAVDDPGNLYIAADNVRKVVPGADGAVNGGSDETITTFAGARTPQERAQEGWVATSSQLGEQLRGLARDGAGNVYVSDTQFCRVRKIDAAGVVTTVAGVMPSLSQFSEIEPCSASSGDGGAATAARLRPDDLAADAAGNLYVADRCRIRKVDASGTISTFAGTGECASSGDGGPAASAGLDYVAGLDIDGAGNLYVAENCRVRKIDTAGVITTVAGTGTCGFSGDGGPARSAQLNGSFNIAAASFDVAVDGAGNLYIADTDNCRVRKVDSEGVITTVAGTGSCEPDDSGSSTGPATAAALKKPRSVVVDGAGNLYVGAGFVYRVDTAGILSRVAGGTEHNGFRGDGAPALRTSIGTPERLAVDRAGKVLIAGSNGSNSSRVRRLTPRPDFFLRQPAEQSVKRGRRVRVPIEVVSTPPGAAFPDPISLYVANLPEGATATFSPHPTTGDTTLTITADRGTAPGSYPLTVFASGGGRDHHTSFDLVVREPVLGGVSFSPEPLAAPGGLRAGASTTAAVTALESDGAPLGGARVYLSFTPAVGGGSAAVGDVALTATPRAFDAGAEGKVTVTHRTPAVLPTGGQDVLRAQDRAESPTVVGEDTYIYAGAATKVDVSLGPARISADGRATARATARVSDANGYRVSNEAVAFSTSGDVTFAPVANHGDGSYSTTVTASTTAGSETITATAAKAGVAGTARLEELRLDEPPPPPPTALDLPAGGPGPSRPPASTLGFQRPVVSFDARAIDARRGRFTGTASHPGGGVVRTVEVALRGARRDRRGRCRWWSPSARRLLRARRPCQRPPWMTAQLTRSGPQWRWTLALGRRLPPGRYVVAVRALDWAGTSSQGVNGRPDVPITIPPPRRRSR